MTREEALIKLKKLDGHEDPEMAHYEADEVICTLLLELGYVDIIDAYNDVPKWYA